MKCFILFANVYGDLVYLFWKLIDNFIIKAPPFVLLGNYIIKEPANQRPLVGVY